MEELIDNVSEKIARVICSEGQELEVIKYGMHQIIVMMLNIMFAVASGIIWHELFFMAVMSVYFSMLRPYVGGYHAETGGKCLVISILLVNLVLYCKQYIRLELSAYIFIWLISMVVIFLWAPIGNPNKELDRLERAFYRKKSQNIMTAGSIGFVAAIIFKLETLYEGIIYGMFLTAVLLMAGKMKYRTLPSIEKF